MSFQAGILLSFAVIMVGGTVYYFNEEYPERVTVTRLGLAILLLGFAALAASVVFLRHWDRYLRPGLGYFSAPGKRRAR